jgi:sugar-specific transcriptional regulator TrmB
MLPQENAEQILRELGLTLAEARIYLALARLHHPSTAKTISCFSKVARQDIYRTLDALQGIGLVEKIVDAPTLFKPIPMRDALSTLYEKRKREDFELQTKMKELLQQFPNNKEEPPQKGEYSFIMVREGKALLKRIERIFDSTQVSADIVGCMSAARQGSNLLPEPFRKAIKRGVKIRLIHEELEKELQGPKIWQSLKAPNLKLRYVRNPLKVSVGIHDYREAVLYIYPKADKMPPPAILSNNPSFVVMCHDHFEKIWETALEYKDQEP